MEEKDDWTCGREGDRHPFTQTNLQDEFVTPIMLVLNYIIYDIVRKFCLVDNTSKKLTMFIKLMIESDFQELFLHDFIVMKKQ